MAGCADAFVSISEAPLPALVHALTTGCDRAEAAGPDSVLLIDINGSGDDPGWPAEIGIHDVTRWERTLRRLERLTAVSIAVARGHCIGPSMEVLLATDFRIAGPDLRLSTPGPGGTLWPGMAVHRLANQIGVAHARRTVLFGDEIDAATAARLGLVDEVTEDPARVGREMADALRRHTTTDLPVRRRLLLDAVGTTFEEALGPHLAACDRTLRTARAGTARP